MRKFLILFFWRMILWLSGVPKETPLFFIPPRKELPFTLAQIQARRKRGEIT
jgi:hypothetical protein